MEIEMGKRAAPNRVVTQESLNEAEILEMAKPNYSQPLGYQFTPEEIIAFARLIQQAQREEDAVICDAKAQEVRDEGITSNALGFMVQDYEECAAAIRNSGGVA